ncbi:hypothetical protein HWV62_39529 [Athelia sp. TMB]|nr:hypothetical protein HWV62_39529 [Athelia sp. TMB]
MAASQATGAITLESQPVINIIDATPPRLQHAHRRLLYRGALSLPDSHLLLGGLTFSGYDTNKGTPGIGLSLLENPLALALESMRGRRTLRFLGIVSLSEGWVDFSGGVQLDIHPEAMLSHIYFENIFCLSGVAFNDGRSCMGVKVASGDSDGPETTEMIIYTQFVSTSITEHPGSPTIAHIDSPAPARMTPSQGTLQLHVARISPTPPPPPSPAVPTSRLRLPRPDDPTPRKVPPSFSRSLSSNHAIAGSSKRGSSTVHVVNPKRRKTDKSGTTLKRQSSGALEDPDVIHAREVMRYGAAIRSASGPGRAVVEFKIPDIPVRARAKAKSASTLTSEVKGKGKANEILEEIDDVFGSTANLKEAAKSAKAKGKRKASEDDLGDIEVAGKEIGEIEKMNRRKIKKQIVKLLSTPTSPPPVSTSTTSPSHEIPSLPGRAMITTAHPEFKEIFGYVYRGVAFALDAHIYI